MFLCTLVIEKAAKANTSRLQLTLVLHSQAGRTSIRAYQTSATLAFDSLEDFSVRFHCKLELKQTFWDIFTKMGVSECIPHSLY